MSTHSLSANQTVGNSVLTDALLSKIVVEYLTVSDVQRCAVVCTDWARWAANEGLKDSISKGHVLPEERPCLWEACAGVASLQKRFRKRGHGHTAQEIYDHYSRIKLSASLEGEISRDVPRTFPNDDFFSREDGRERLRRVLHAVYAFCFLLFLFFLAWKLRSFCVLIVPFDIFLPPGSCVLRGEFALPSHQ